jgi:hypothetical protein
VGGRDNEWEALGGVNEWEALGGVNEWEALGGVKAWLRRDVGSVGTGHVGLSHTTMAIAPDRQIPSHPCIFASGQRQRGEGRGAARSTQYSCIVDPGQGRKQNCQGTAVHGTT